MAFLRSGFGGSKVALVCACIYMYTGGYIYVLELWGRAVPLEVLQSADSGAVPLEVKQTVWWYCSAPGGFTVTLL